jgi:uncharacterized protein YjbJ (UPF0337 family)
MSTSDKIKNKGQEIRGEIKEKVGDAKGDNKLKAEGRADHAKGSLKQAGEKVKDAL